LFDEFPQRSKAISRNVYSLETLKAEANSSTLFDLYLWREVDHLLREEAELLTFAEKTKSTIVDRFKAVATGSVLINLVLIGCLVSIFVLSWFLVLSQFKERVLSCKNVITLLPAAMLTQNMRVSKYLQTIFNATNKRSFY